MSTSFGQKVAVQAIGGITVGIAIVVARFLPPYLNSVSKIFSSSAKTTTESIGKLTAENPPKLSQEKKFSLKNIPGCREAKDKLEQISKLPKNISPKLIVLKGPPGNGKLTLAKSFASKIGAAFIPYQPDKIPDIYKLNMLTQTFENALAQKKAVVYINNVELISGKSNPNSIFLANYLERCCSENHAGNVIVIVSTSEFGYPFDQSCQKLVDEIIPVLAPDKEERKEIFNFYLKDTPHDIKKEELDEIASMSFGFSIKDIISIIIESKRDAEYKSNKAVRPKNPKNAAHISDKAIRAENLLEGILKISIGSRITDKMSKKEKRITATHEAGHAVATLGTDLKVKLINIEPREKNLGLTFAVPKEERQIGSLKESIHSCIYTLGGRAAEEVISKEITTGASSDLAVVTHIIWNMANRFGMTKGGMSTLSKKPKVIEEAVAYIYDLTKTKIEKYKKLIEEVADYLLENGNMSGEKFYSIAKKYPECSGHQIDFSKFLYKSKADKNSDDK
ncbi:MAG: AAA family ATPase [Oscillospiraceae bacterium]|jgi:cell division protease FtsH|nr:AAA family ATPase [Oscillospiraceae bacterium]